MGQVCQHVFGKSELQRDNYLRMVLARQGPSYDGILQDPMLVGFIRLTQRTVITIIIILFIIILILAILIIIIIIY